MVVCKTCQGNIINGVCISCKSCGFVVGNIVRLKDEYINNEYLFPAMDIKDGFPNRFTVILLKHENRSSWLRLQECVERHGTCAHPMKYFEKVT